MEKIYIAIDNERLEATGEILDQILIDQQIDSQRKAEAEAKAQAKAELLERLGITADEAKLLLS